MNRNGFLRLMLSAVAFTLVVAVWNSNADASLLGKIRGGCNGGCDLATDSDSDCDSDCASDCGKQRRRLRGGCCDSSCETDSVEAAPDADCACEKSCDSDCKRDRRCGKKRDRCRGGNRLSRGNSDCGCEKSDDAIEGDSGA
jgi:hypothetical protein